MRCYTMTRSFADHMGFKWPKEIACIVDGRPVTYKELRAKKKALQDRRLAQIREIDQERRAAYVWVFFQPHWLYHGWHLYLRTVNDSWWLIRMVGGTELTLDIMRALPCGLLPVMENFERWKEVVGRTFHRPGRFKKQALIKGWLLLERGRPQSFTPS